MAHLSHDFPSGPDIKIFNDGIMPPFSKCVSKGAGHIYIKFSSGDQELFDSDFEVLLKEELDYYKTHDRIRNYYILVTYENFPSWWDDVYSPIFKMFRVNSMYAHYTEYLNWDKFDPTNRILTKHFTCLNNRMNWYRFAIYRFMLSKQLTDSCYLSCIMSKRQNENIYDCDIDFPFTQGQDFAEIIKTIPYKNFEESDIPNSGDWSYGRREFVENSFCNLVTETYNESPFFTEKTFKCFANMQPFLLYGGANSLQYLKDLGFKTFDGIFDESYDSEENHILRFEKFTEEVERISKFSLSDCKKMLSSVIPILEHNYNHFKYNLPKMFDSDMKRVTIEVNKIVEQARKRITST